MPSLAIGQPTLRVNSNPSLRGPESVSLCCLGPELVALLANRDRPQDLLKSLFRVTVAQTPSREGNTLPDVAGRYLLFEDEVQFIPHFPFERNVKYCVIFDPQPLDVPIAGEPLNLEFQIPSEQQETARTEVTNVFPSSEILPENLLRFYVCFSNSMQRGRALEEISLLDSHGLPVADALYRAPLELWDRNMRHLTVLLDPGRLKRWVGPNVELGPPLKAGQKYTLEVGSGMIDLHGRPLREIIRKHFVAGDPVRQCISLKDWKILPPVTDTRQALVILFPGPLDWALLFRTIAVESADGAVIEGQVAVDQCERRWSFTPSSSWIAGRYSIRIGSTLEDVCGNSLSGAFDRPIQKHTNPITEISGSSLFFRLI
jgi:hypothetical protein